MMKPSPLSVLKGSLRTTLYTSRRHQTTNYVKSSNNMRWDQAKPYSDIPQVPTVPLLGSGWQFLPVIGLYDFHKRDHANRMKIKRHGPIFRELFNSTEYLICTTMADLQTIVLAEGPHPIAMELTSVKAYRESRKDVFSNKGLLCMQGEEWFNLRSATQKFILKPSYIRQYLEPVRDVAKDFAKRINVVKDETGEVSDLLDEIYKWSLECVCLYGLDKRLGCLQNELPPDAAKVIDAAVTLFEMKTKLETFTGSVTFWKLFKTKTWRKFEKASDIYTDLTFKYINESVAELRNNPKDLTILQAMLQNGGLKVSDATVFVSDLLLAGMDTTSYTAGFLLYNLARNPKQQELVYQEVMKLLPSENTELTPDIMEDLKYLKACWKESMRLTPIVPARGRITSEDLVLSGYQVPAGTRVGVIYEPMYMDEEIFEDPTAFKPERWLTDRNERPPVYAFKPFGYGFRNCIGKRLAEIQLVSLVAEVVRKYKISYHHEPIGICSKLLNVPDKPLKFNFKERAVETVTTEKIFANDKISLAF